jgi:hypothetical protein
VRKEATENKKQGEADVPSGIQKDKDSGIQKDKDSGIQQDKQSKDRVGDSYTLTHQKREQGILTLYTSKERARGAYTNSYTLTQNSYT